MCWENVELVRILLTAGANIDSCTIGHKSAIMHSALFCDTDELHQILIGASSKDYSSITHDRVLEAASTGAQALSKYLLAKKGKPGDLLHEAVLESAFKFACKNSNHNAVISLLDIGVDPNCLLPSNVGEPLRNVVSQSDFELIKILLQAGADINTPGILSTAIRDNMRIPHDIKMFQFLLDKGAKLEIHGEVALRYAASRGSFEAVELLVFSGVDVNAGAGDSNKLTVLQEAVLAGNIGPVKILLVAGSDVHAITSQEEHQTALEIAVKNVAISVPQKLEMVQVLLEAGSDVNIPENKSVHQYSNLL